MQISERIFDRLSEIKMSQSEFSRQTGISTSTINDWKQKKTNPSADKLICICRVLNISLTDLLSENTKKETDTIDYLFDEKYLIEKINTTDIVKRRKMITCLEKVLFLLQVNLLENPGKRNISVIQDVEGNQIVIINDIRFKGKRSINWKEVREYLKEYVGDFYKIADTDDIVYIGSDLPVEYSGSKYTKSLKGTNAKAKANAAQGTPELIEIAVGKYHRENHEEKHKRNAKNGWYRYDSRFALPIYDDKGAISRYNVFHASMLIRYSSDGRLYLYDILDVKKETSNPLSS